MLATCRRLVKHLPKYIQKRLPKQVAVIEISAKESRRLNRLYRKKDKSTNVLSFRYSREYGEILLCSEVIRKEAKLDGNPENYQMTRMVIHAMLHLGGVHHELSQKAEAKMEKLEIKILKKVLGEKFKVQTAKSKMTS